MRLRRAEDREVSLLVAAPVGRLEEGRIASSPAPRLSSSWMSSLEETARVPREVVLLLDLDADEPVGVAIPLSGGGSEGALAGTLAGGPAAWRQEALRARRRRRLPEKLVAFFEALIRAECEAEVSEALRGNAVRIVGAHTAEVLVRGADGMLRSPGDDEGARPALPWTERFARPGLICATEVRGTPALAPLFRHPGTSLVAHVPFGDDGVLVLTERRDDRVFEAEDWEVLRVLSLQGEMALKRCRLVESVRSLSLTDPLTGLANRRHMELVLGHAWPAALRGDGLTLAVLDLDGFKEVNDERGHLAGDDLLRAVASALRAEARGSDTVVRYGGDEFLVILPGSDEAGAASLLERVRRRLAGTVGISAGIAGYAAGYASAEELIREADRRLYQSKRARPAAIAVPMARA